MAAVCRRGGDKEVSRAVRNGDSVKSLTVERGYNLYSVKMLWRQRHARARLGIG